MQVPSRPRAGLAAFAGVRVVGEKTAARSVTVHESPQTMIRHVGRVLVGMLRSEAAPGQPHHGPPASRSQTAARDVATGRNIA